MASVFYLDPSRANSSIPGLSRLREGTPQLVAPDMKLYVEPNRYLRDQVMNGSWQSSHTWKAGAGALADFLSWCEQSVDGSGKSLEWQAISEEHLFAFRDALLQVTKSDGVALKPETANAKVQQVISFYEWASKRGLAPFYSLTVKLIGYKRRDGVLAHLNRSQPATMRAITLRSHEEPVRFLVLDQVSQLLKKMSSKRWRQLERRNRLIALCMLQVGLRHDEVFSMTVSGFNSIPAMDQSNWATTGRIVGKGNKPRAVLWPNSLLLEIENYIDEERELWAEKSREHNGIAPLGLWLTTTGSVVSYDSIGSIIEEAGERADIECYPHMLRHTFATYHYLANKDLSRLSRLLGHADLSTTQVYVHTSELVESAGYIDDYQKAISAICAEAL